MTKRDYAAIGQDASDRLHVAMSAGGGHLRHVMHQLDTEQAARWAEDDARYERRKSLLMIVVPVAWVLGACAAGLAVAAWLAAPLVAMLGVGGSAASFAGAAAFVGGFVAAVAIPAGVMRLIEHYRSRPPSPEQVQEHMDLMKRLLQDANCRSPRP